MQEPFYCNPCNMKWYIFPLPAVVGAAGAMVREGRADVAFHFAKTHSVCGSSFPFPIRIFENQWGYNNHIFAMLPQLSFPLEDSCSPNFPIKKSCATRATC